MQLTLKKKNTTYDEAKLRRNDMTAYDDLLVEISKNTWDGFQEGTKRMISYVDKLSKENISEMLLDIGAIPQTIKPSSSEEKLYSKVTDIVLSRCFNELGLESKVLESRGNSADVSAHSPIYGYSLVADSKAMRLSRTAKNQKDFKVGALGDSWVGDSDTYAVLCCPLYQYPDRKSQIYEQALNNRTCLFSWEHLKFLIDNNIVESDDLTLEQIWGSTSRLSRTVLNDRNSNFFDKVNEIICTRISCTKREFNNKIHQYYSYVAKRAKNEQDAIVEEKVRELKKLTREEAIEMLVSTEIKKTQTMEKLISKLEGDK